MRAAAVHVLRRRDAPLPPPGGSPLLPYGRGLSYGDCCLNDGGILLDTGRLDRLIDFDEARGLLRCEAGATLGDILDRAAPRGWFLPVVPGTRQVTVGGAVANDVHGKNHHVAGTFGTHVRRLELLRSSEGRLECAPGRPDGLFEATVGGLGLTGLVTWAEIALERVPGPWIGMETLRFRSFEEGLDLLAASDRTHPYTVAWIDALAGGRHLGRGILYRGRHVEAPPGARPPVPRAPIPVPCDAPAGLLNRFTVGVFNALQYRRAPARAEARVPYDAFFFPLDRLADWNRLYGRAGFLQYQCVVPDRQAARALLSRVSAQGPASPLAVLKAFGTRRSPGLLSFPRPGITLALDFPIRDGTIFQFLETLDARVRDAGGAVYPAKDARMSARSFQAFFPAWRELARRADPAFSSSLWRRVTEGRGSIPARTS
jgi:FAD/FMN-containing dehydrogenase